MGCFYIGLIVLAVALIVLFFYAVKAAIYGLVGVLICGVIGAVAKGREGMQIGAVLGFVIGVLWAFFF